MRRQLKQVEPPRYAPGSEEERVLKMATVLLAKARDARQDASKFFEFVMRDEKSQLPIKVADHQKVVLDFAMAHELCVIRLPADHAKTFTIVGLTLFLMGQDVTQRGAIVGAEQGIAEKPLSMVRDYIEQSRDLSMVFPLLRKSQRQGDPWTQTKLTLDRPPGIKDPSLMAVGIDGSIVGSRLSWIVVDDILNRENTSTQEQRRKVIEWFDSSVLSRRIRPGGRVIVSNTAWHPEDITHVLQGMGWPTIQMDVMGGIDVWNADNWDHDLLVPEHPGSLRCRLKTTKPTDTLWMARYDHEGVAELQKNHLPHRFNQLYMNLCRDDDTARCKIEWIEQCKTNARDARHFSLVSEYTGPNLTFTGVDLAISPGEEHDDCAFFTFEAMPNGQRKILDIEVGQFDGPSIIKKLFQKHQQYKSFLRVENNGAQDFIKQFALAQDMSLPIKPHTTGRTKAHPEHGVEGLFVELSNGAWIIPNDAHGNVHPAVKRFIDECLYYAPAQHTGDVLMACYFAREQAKIFGRSAGKDNGQGMNVASIMAR
jgi:hypothetical protein